MQVVIDADRPNLRRKARARLALRAERAFGLESITRFSSLTDVESDPLPPSPPAHPPAVHPPDGPLPVALGAQTIAPTARPAIVRAGDASSIPLTPLNLSADEKRARLIALDENEVRGCRRCRLCEQRTHTVFGEGDPNAKIFFVGEGPGQTEDETGRPFVGRAGAMLDKMIRGMGLRREDVFIANIVKCRPPGNREPSIDEVATCTPYLQRQLEIIHPAAIITLGKPAAHHMLQTKSSMSSLRGRWHEWRGVKLMPTFHPAFLVRAYTRANREMVWSDLCAVLEELQLPIPKPAARE